MSVFPKPLFLFLTMWVGFHLWGFSGMYTPFYLQSYLDDVLFIPLVMGCSLFVQHQWVSPAFVYLDSTIVYVWLYLIVVFEWIFPILNPAYTSDWIDGIAYLAGALLFKVLLNKPLKR